MKPVTRSIILALASVVMLMASGCATSGPHRTYRKMYPGPVRSTNEIAIIRNDLTSGVYLENTRNGFGKVATAIAVLPGKQKFAFEYYQAVYNGYYHSTKPFVLTDTVEAGHQYQVVGSSSQSFVSLSPSLGDISSFGNTFSAFLMDITTQDDIWKYYERELGDDHKLLAVDKLTDQSRLQQVAKTSPKPAVRARAARKIADAEFLKSILDNEIDANVRTAIQARLQALKP